MGEYAAAVLAGARGQDTGVLGMDAVWRFQNKMFFLTSVVKSRPLDANIGDLIKSCYIVNSAVDPRK